VCPLAPGDYTAAVHDQFGFSIDEDGWQEERQQNAESTTRIVLSRIDDPALRLSFYSGSTGPTSPVDLGAATVAPPGFTAGQPVDLTISGTQAQSLDLVSAGAGAPVNLTIEDASVSVEPDKSYRLTLAKIPMDQEAAAIVMVTEAPADKFAAFVTQADAIVKSVKFAGS
jgi:hypothetical protein